MVIGTKFLQMMKVATEMAIIDHQYIGQDRVIIGIDKTQIALRQQGLEIIQICKIDNLKMLLTKGDSRAET